VIIEISIPSKGSIDDILTFLGHDAFIIFLIKVVKKEGKDFISNELQPRSTGGYQGSTLTSEGVS